MRLNAEGRVVVSLWDFHIAVRHSTVKHDGIKSDNDIVNLMSFSPTFMKTTKRPEAPLPIIRPDDSQ